MDKKTIFVKTSKGDDETTSKTSHLYGDIKRIMSLVDNKSTVAELTKRAAPSLRETLEEALQKLVDSGFIQEKDKAGSAVKISTPAMPANKSKSQAENSGEELDFTNAVRTSVEAKARQEAAARERAEDEAARLLAEQEAVRISAELAAAEGKAKQEAEAKARAEAEVARLKAEQEAARIRAELAAAEAKARAEAEVARLKAEQEAVRIRIEREAAQANARAAAEATRLKAEQEAAQVKARAEAEVARVKAEQEASRSRAEQEVTRAKERAEAQAKARAATEATRLKAEQEAVQAKARAAVEAARLKAEQEEARVLAELAAAQAREQMEAEARIKAQAEAEARTKQDLVQTTVALAEQNAVDSAAKKQADEQINKLAQAQAKVWSDAEQRAKTQAAARVQQREVKPAAQQEAKAPSPESAHQVRKIRKPLPWGKAGASLIILLLLAIFLLPYVWPMQGYVAKIEQKLSAQLQQPVHIGNLHVTLLPRQKMEFRNVSVGNNKALQADKITLTFGVATLFAQAKTISNAEIENLTFGANSFIETLSWLQAAGSVTNYPVARMVLQHAQVSDAGLKLPNMNGIVDFDGRGGLVKAIFNSEDGKLGLEVQPQQLFWQIALNVRESTLPSLPQIMFSELSLSGMVDKSAASFNDIDGYLYGGRMLGSARLTWQNGWQLQGNLKVKNVELKDALPQLVVAGKLDSDLKFILRGGTLPLLTQAPRLEGSLVVKNGLISKVDIVEMVLTPGRRSTSGGRTHFDEISGTLLIDTDGLHLRQLKISAGVMSAKGYLDVALGKEVPNKKLSGRLGVDLTMRAEMGSAPLLISGTLADPELQAGR